MFKCMDIAEQVYKGGKPSKTTTGEDANHASHDSKYKEGEAASPTNPEKGRAGKRKLCRPSKLLEVGASMHRYL